MIVQNELIQKFEKQIGIQFQNQNYLIEALTHSSYANKNKQKKRSNNERLEFFGDSILKYIVSEYLFQKYPDENEGNLSKLRSKIISDQFLATLGKDINLGDFLYLSFGEIKSGGKYRDSNLANAFEALLGAIYLDKGIKIVKIFFFKLYSKFETTLETDNFSDFKSKLQEKCQKYKINIPKYKIIREEGPDHQRTFHIECCVIYKDITLISQGYSQTKKKAEQDAAKYILKMFTLLK